jgi:nucleoside-diphosphate-sugar epimerase
MTIFITGVTGYIGQKLLQVAVAKGHRVHGLVRDPHSIRLIQNQNVSYFKGDITEYESVVSAMKDCDAVLHTAAITQFWHKDRSVFYRVNVGGTRNVLEAACLHKVKKLVFTSSCAVLGPSLNGPVTEDDPRVTPFENDYEISKHCAEELVKEYCHRRLFAVIVCPPRVYGPGLATKGNPIGKLIDNAIKRKLAFLPSAKNVIGNYAFIDDVVEGHFLAMEKGLAGEKYILGGENLSYETFFDNIRQVSKQNIRFIRLPRRLLKMIGAANYGLSVVTNKHSHLTPKTVDRLFQNRAVNSEKAVRQLGYTITPFKVGVERTIQFLKSKDHV